MYRKSALQGPATSRRKIVSSPASGLTSKSFEAQTLQQEVNHLRSSLADAMMHVEEVKKKQEEETKSLKLAYDVLRKELDTLKFEKEENDIRQSNGIEEYSKLTLELIKLRTEIDRLSNLYEREKRTNQMREIESKLQEETLIQEFN